MTLLQQQIAKWSKELQHYVEREKAEMKKYQQLMKAAKSAKNPNQAKVLELQAKKHLIKATGCKANQKVALDSIKRLQSLYSQDNELTRALKDIMQQHEKASKELKSLQQELKGLAATTKVLPELENRIEKTKKALDQTRQVRQQLEQKQKVIQLQKSKIAKVGAEVSSRAETFIKQNKQKLENALNQIGRLIKQFGAKLGKKGGIAAGAAALATMGYYGYKKYKSSKEHE